MADKAKKNGKQPAGASTHNTTFSRLRPLAPEKTEPATTLAETAGKYGADKHAAVMRELRARLSPREPPAASEGWVDVHGEMRADERVKREEEREQRKIEEENRKIDELDAMFGPTLPRNERFERMHREREESREREEREENATWEVWEAEQEAKKDV